MDCCTAVFYTIFLYLTKRYLQKSHGFYFMNLTADTEVVISEGTFLEDQEKRKIRTSLKSVYKQCSKRSWTFYRTSSKS